MVIDGWRYYNHAAIPTTPPHETADLSPIQDKTIWQMNGKPYFARWTSDFDCGYETNWWYVIKDTQFDISNLKAKRRYEINKGVKFFDVKEISPMDYKEELYHVQASALSAYPVKYRPNLNKTSFLLNVEKWSSYITLGAFLRETGELCGYALLTYENESCVNFMVLKTKHEYENKSVNAALVEGAMRRFESFLATGGYICDGSRSINHETAFQDYLEKYFEFRKAYCKLHVTYKSTMAGIVKCLFPFRKVLLCLDGVKIIHQLNSVLRMEEIARRQNE